VQAKIFNVSNKTYVSIKNFDDKDGKLIARKSQSPQKIISSIGSISSDQNQISGNEMALTKAHWDVFFKNINDINIDVQKADI
jgi:hypothetical protein